MHVLEATIWVGGQFTLAGLVPTVKQFGEDAPKRIANAFARIMWPAYAVLLITGFWNVSVVQKGQPSAWKVVLGIKIAVVLLAGLARGSTAGRRAAGVSQSGVRQRASPRLRPWCSGSSSPVEDLASALRR